MRFARGCVRVLGVCGALAACDDEARGRSAPRCDAKASLELYARRIEPILSDDHPASCNQCHLAGIDLSLFVKATPCQTMACLKSQGLVDFDNPEESTVLAWIGRAKPESELITKAVISAEHDGLLEWIRYSSACGEDVCESFTDPCGLDAGAAHASCSPSQAVSADFVDPGDCSELTLEQLFSTQIYRWRDRCFPCHFASDDRVPSAPKWLWDTDPIGNAPSVACQAGSLQSMRTVLRRGYVNLDEPAQSLLLLKPLSVAGGGVPHGGDQKFSDVRDPSYKTFLHWVKRYAACAEADPTLPKAGEPPPFDTEPGAGASEFSIFGYCNCMLLKCHDEAHAKWGPSDEDVIGGCRAEAAQLPVKGSATLSGNFLECRAAFCDEHALAPDACSAALGETICR